jgi:Animal haem peroxidase
VEKHGSETFFVLGEGLLGETVGGREPRLAVSARAPAFRFTRMGPKGTRRQLGEANLRRVADAMTGPGRPSRVPAGFTYLGQFVDHDLTFDRTDVMLGENVPASELVQARSPSLDLDSLYGGGPGDPDSAKFYESDGLHLKMGRTVAAEGDPAKDGFDLPRRGSGSTAKKRREALIPDPRNDENLAVAQTHLAFIRFHNRVVDTLPASVPPSERFARTRKLVTKHYQWMLRTDYLPRICERRVVTDVFRSGRKAFEAGADPADVPTMPIEFSVAAFRLGHSMVRGGYEWNIRFDTDAGLRGTLDLLFTFSGLSGNLGGEPRLPSNWIADFRRLYDFGQAGRSDLTVPERKFNRALRIDTMLVNPLATLPGFPRREASLALRNLTRARMVTLATGQQMTRFLRSRGLRPDKLTNAQIRQGRNGAKLDGLTNQQRTALVRNTPLWFYVLREAELNGGKLDGVGARIVAETFHRAMEGSRASIVRDRTWRPTLGPNNRTFRMVDLLLFAFEGNKDLLAPLG